jgi:hypothetical protein
VLSGKNKLKKSIADHTYLNIVDKTNIQSGSSSKTGNNGRDGSTSSAGNSEKKRGRPPVKRSMSKTSTKTSTSNANKPKKKKPIKLDNRL